MKTYVITGSTSGIGKSLTEEFSKDKNNIIFAGYRNEKKIAQNHPENIIYFYMDMANSESISKASEYIKTKTNHIDTLINVAGMVIAGPMEHTSTDRLRQQFDINTFSHLEFSQNLVDIMENSKIINISSVASFGHFPFIAPYCASKRALDILFNAFAIENHKKIKVISVKPGVIATPLWDKSVKLNINYLNEYKDYEKELEFIKYNALKNTTSGLPVEKVTKLIKKIDAMPKPKCSYTIGWDAKAGEFLSYLPQDVVNVMIKFALKYRIKHKNFT